MSREMRAIDTGTAYGMPKPSYDAALTEVGPGTPMGELLRRYWHPVGKIEDATETPRLVRVLGEDLILFRDGAGKAGLLYPRCCHRGTTLYYGRVEERGIRCCYHGWLFDVEGHCLDQPCEPEGGRQRHRMRQPWYPVEERYGLIFAYLGPPERKPVLPRYECLEVMDPGEFVEADDSSIGSGGPQVVDCNWLQHFENIPDTWHVPVLHGWFSGPQFVPEIMAPPKVKWKATAHGVTTLSLRTLDDGRIFYRVSEAVLPTLRVVPNPFVTGYVRVESIGWTLPIDDTHYRIYVAGRVKKQGEMSEMFRGAQRWKNLSPAERQRFPGDYEAQRGQGEITFHSEEHLASSDKGVAMLRRLLRRQLAAVAEGRDPAGISFDPAAPPIVFDAGNYIVAPEDARLREFDTAA